MTKPLHPIIDLNHPLSKGLVGFWCGNSLDPNLIQTLSEVQSFDDFIIYYSDFQERIDERMGED